MADMVTVFCGNFKFGFGCDYDIVIRHNKCDFCCGEIFNTEVNCVALCIGNYPSCKCRCITANCYGTKVRYSDREELVYTSSRKIGAFKKAVVEFGEK